MVLRNISLEKVFISSLITSQIIGFFFIGKNYVERDKKYIELITKAINESEINKK